MASRRLLSKIDSQTHSPSGGKRTTPPSHILYDLNVYSEWSQEIENAHRSVKEKTASGLAGKLYSTAQRSVWTFLRSVGVQSSAKSPCNLPINLVKLANVKLGWSICLSPDGEYLAVLQDTVVEIRSRRDNYSSVLGKKKLPEDENPQWRRMTWSYDSQILAVSQSTGTVSVLDILGGEFFSLNEPEVAGVATDLSFAVASMIFTEPEKGTDSKWDLKFTIITHQGLLTRYMLNMDESECEVEHHFQFSSVYPQGVSSAVYSQAHSLLIVTGLASANDEFWSTKAGQEGITAWRVLSGYPYYKRVTDYQQDASGGGQGFLRKFTSAMYGAIYGNVMQELVLKSCLSPDGKYLLTLSTESKLCLYSMPSLTLVHSWSADHQPCSDKLSPSVQESSRKTKYLQETPHYFQLLDIAWWSNDEIILARYSGAVLVADIESLSNRLGESPEWFEPCPQVQQAHDGGFLSLECESKVLTGSRSRTVSESGQGDESGSDDDEESDTILKKTNRVFRETLYYITDMDRFEPPMKRTRLVKKTFRLVSLKSTTPDELFARKIDMEEYGEALVLARLYHLDSDMVYQRQWRKSDVTLASIHDYLSKIRKRTWVLHECLERVPNNIDAMRELLQYGLRGTDLEALVKIGQGRDKGRFIVSREVQLDESYDEYDQDCVDELELLKQKHRQGLLEQVDFENLNLEQKELCRIRLKLLTYLDRLATYEQILGGGRFAEQHFDPKFFQRFRSQNVVEAITDYARIGDWKAVDTMFVYLGDQTLPHRLAILSNIPETLPPQEYADLLPLVESGQVVEFPQESLREADWCELSEYRKYIESGGAGGADFLYEECETLQPFCAQPLTPDLLTSWYRVRSCDIEKRSRLVDHALQFVEIGMDNGVKNLQSLRDDLSVMERIVYECNYGDSLSFEQLQQMDDLARLKTIMSKSTPEKYAIHIQKWMRPFLKSCEMRTKTSYHPLLCQYLKDLAVDDLQLVFKVFECSRAGQPAETKLLRTEECFLRAAVDCIFACERDDQLSYVLSILECLPNRKSGSMERSLVKLHNELDDLEDLISAAEILEVYGVTMTISAVKASQDDVHSATMLMRKLTRRANNRTPSLTTAEWTQLQSHMSTLQTKVYRCIDKYACCEIFVESLLCSGKTESIELSLNYMEGDMESSTHSMTSSVGSLSDSTIPFQRAVEIVVKAAKEYFNSSGSHEDQNMKLAEACLNLFSAPHPLIKEEKDLIQALPLLPDFGITLIPLKVRLCGDRLELIKQALQSSRTAYKQYPKLLKLADGLKVDECAVLQLIVKEALAVNDCKFAYKHCKNLMEKDYPDVWNECYQLASDPQFTDVEARMALLSYTLVHCSDEMIEEVLNKRMALKNDILLKRIESTVRRQQTAPTSEVSEVDGHSQSKSDWQALFSAEAAVGALAKTTKHTKTLLSNLGGITASLISGRKGEEVRENTDFSSQGCHAFYEDVIADCFASVELDGSKRLEMSSAEDMLRSRKLAESLSRGADAVEDCSEILVNCALHALPADVTLGLAFLLAIPEASAAEHCFSKLTRVPLTLRLGAYYYALQLLSSMSFPAHGTVSETISEAQKLPPQKRAGDAAQEMFNNLDLYVRLMDDYSQACYLQSLGKEVDSHQFTADNEYKKEIILSLTRSLDQTHYDTAVSMAKRYSVSMWDVYMTHLQYLLVESGLTTTQVDKRVDKLAIVDELLSKPEEFGQRMSDEVLPHVEGTDMAKLQLYYKLVESCPSFGRVSALTHRKLLSKLIPAAPGLDYGALLSCPDDPIAIIRPVLKSGNVHVFSKMSDKIPTADGCLSSSAVFTAWAQKLFVDGPSANSKVPESTAAWVHRYESCGEFLNKMEPQDNINFLKHALFSSKALETVPLEARQEICRRNIKHCKANSGKAKSGLVSWAEALETTQQYQTHLEKMGSEELIGLRLAEDVQVRSYHRKIDACMSQPDQLKEVLVCMLLDGQALELVHDVLNVIPLQGWTVRDALTEAMRVIFSHIREGKGHLQSNGKATLNVFENLISQVGEHQKEEGELVSSEDVMSLFRPVIADTSLDMQTRLHAVNMLEQHLELDSEDRVMVLLYQTQAITFTHWPDLEGLVNLMGRPLSFSGHQTQSMLIYLKNLCLRRCHAGKELAPQLVNRSDINTEKSRTSLFLQLVRSASRLEQFLSLSSLLTSWPAVTDVNSLWIQLVDGLLQKVESKQAAENVVALCLTERLAAGVVQHSYSALRGQEHLHQAAVLALNSGSPVLQEDLVNMIYDHSEVFVEDEAVLRGLLEHHLVVNVADSELFKPLVEYLASHQKEADFLDPHIVINELLQAKRTSEATIVDKACRGQHGLSSLSAAAGAISAISKWWRKD